MEDQWATFAQYYNTNWEQKLERRLFSLEERIFALDSKYVRYKQRNTVYFIKFY